MRRLLLAMPLLLLASPVLAQTSGARFQCAEEAFDLDRCIDEDDPGPECRLASPFLRTTPAQRIFRFVRVQDGPFIDISLGMTAEDSQDDTRFTQARDRLCVPPPPPLVCPVPGSGGGGSAAVSGFSIGPAWYGGNPGLNLFIAR
jgi:hypothetical protein